MNTLLKKQSIGIFFILLISLFTLNKELSSQIIIYNEINSSISSLYADGIEDSYELDVDNDGATNITFYTKFYTCTCSMGSATAFINRINLNSDTEYIYSLNSGGGGVGIFNYDDSMEINSDNFYSDNSTGQLLTSEPCQQYGGGGWNNLQAYMGFRIIEGENYYYGWVKLSVNKSSTIAEIIIHDYAYCTLPNVQITAGQTDLSIPTTAVEAVIVDDVSDNGDGRDLEVLFNKIEDESTLEEYRVMVVKGSDSYSFDLETADTVTNYYSITPNGDNQIITILEENSKDCTGDLITTDIGYRVFVLSVANGISANINALSPRSDLITLIGGAYVSANEANIILDCYPNPANENINFNSDENISEIEIYNINGSKVTSNSFDSKNGNINVSNLSAGQYYFIFKTKDHDIVKEIIIK